MFGDANFNLNCEEEKINDHFGKARHTDHLMSIIRLLMNIPNMI